MGDFNCVCNTKDRSARQTGYDASATDLQVMLQEHNLVDFACQMSDPIQYTSFQGTSHAGLDRIYVSGNIFDSMIEYQVKPVIFYVQCLVLVSYGLERERAFRRQWELRKLNVKLLGDEESKENCFSSVRHATSSQHAFFFF